MEPRAEIHRLASAQLATHLPELARLLLDTVNGADAALGFLPPITMDEARRYWFSLYPELSAETRILLGAVVDGRVVGAGQLWLVSRPNGRHRAEIQKLFVAAAHQGRGIGKTLMLALHDVARQHGRRLLLLHTRRFGPAEDFYKKMGYEVVGTIPRYTLGSDGAHFDSVSLYQDLG